MERELTEPSEVTRPATYANVYRGSYRDKNPDMRAVCFLLIFYSKINYKHPCFLFQIGWYINLRTR
jgi:hypothetical protein